MIPRNNDEIQKLRQSGLISAQALKATVEMVKPGVNLLEIERVATEIIEKAGAKSAFKSVPGYSWTTCLTVNNEVVHGIPRDFVLKEGDLLSIDLGAQFAGWNTDCAWSVIAGGQTTKFLQAGEESMWAGVKQAKAGNRVGDIGQAMQEVVEAKNGFKVVRSLVGHGIGKQLHEDPEVPGFGHKGAGMMLKSGMSLAIEAIYTETTTEVVDSVDGWTLISADGSLGGMFEMTVIVGENGPEVLTDWRKI